MAYQDRVKLYRAIKQIRKKPLIAYVTSIRPNLSGQMGGDAIPQIIEQINKIPKTEESIDFLIISNGGDPITALRIVGILRERFKQVSVLLPYVAYSAATILSLGADEIVMHPYSNLGPVDPQLTVIRKNGQGIPENLHFSSEDLRNFIDFIKSDVGVSDQEHLISAISPLLKDVGPLPIGSAKRSQQLSLSLSVKMLCTHMEDKNKATSIAQALNSSFYHHGYAVNRKEAVDIGLNICMPSEKLEKLMWDIWLDFSKEMKCDIAFDVIKELRNNPQTSNIINAAPVVNLPANTPPTVAQQIIGGVAQQATIQNRTALNIKEMLGAIESSNLSKAVFANVDILYWRNFDMSLGINCTTFTTDWA